MPIFRSQRGESLIGPIVAVLLIVVVVFALFGGITYKSVPPDKIGLHYSGGPIDGTKFQQVIDPGSGNQFLGLNEKLYLLPATQRTYSVARDGSGDEGKPDAISAPSSDDVPMTFEVDVNFLLNDDPEVIREFFEDICLHNECWKLDKAVTDDEGWRQMLRARLRPQLQNAVAQAAKKFTAADLYSDADTLKAMNAEVSANLKDAVNRNLGGPYFCGLNPTEDNPCPDFSVIISNPLPPKGTLDALAATAAEVEAKNTAQAEAEKKLIAAEGEAAAKITSAKGEADAQRERAKSPSLSPEQIEYLKAQALLACAQNTNCTLVITNDDTGVNVNASPGG